jgi:formiminotetrahydrofolate cyclodeaminase
LVFSLKVSFKFFSGYIGDALAKMLLQQRGKMKEEQLMKKVKEILTEEEKMRIPIAQGLPWTIDEPEVRSISHVNP